MNRLFENAGIELITRWILGLIFVYASYHKIIDPPHFAKIIYGYYLFPTMSINLLAIILPFLELFCGAALILGIYPRSAVLILNVMLFAFITAITINLIRGHEFDCGCFSFGEAGYTSSSEQLLIRNVIYFLMGIHVLFFGKSRKFCVRQSGGLQRNLIS